MRAPFLTPVTRTTLTTDICKKMVNHLMRGDWKEGDRIPSERDLCQQLGVGRASLREALKALEIIGMLETRLGEGTFVCGRSEFYSRPILWAIAGSAGESADELIEARRLIEVELAGLAAERATPEDCRKLGQYLDQMEEAGSDLVKFQEADISFHLAVAEAAHNGLLLNALCLIRNLMQQWIGAALHEEGVAEQARLQHQQVFIAVAKRNPEAARAAMKRHLDAMAQRLLQARGTEAKPSQVDAGHMIALAQTAGQADSPLASPNHTDSQKQ